MYVVSTRSFFCFSNFNSMLNFITIVLSVLFVCLKLPRPWFYFDRFQFSKTTRDTTVSCVRVWLWWHINHNIAIFIVFTCNFILQKPQPKSRKRYSLFPVHSNYLCLTVCNKYFLRFNEYGFYTQRNYSTFRLSLECNSPSSL